MNCYKSINIQKVAEKWAIKYILDSKWLKFLNLIAINLDWNSVSLENIQPNYTIQSYKKLDCIISNEHTLNYFKKNSDKTKKNYNELIAKVKQKCYFEFGNKEKFVLKLPEIVKFNSSFSYKDIEFTQKNFRRFKFVNRIMQDELILQTVLNTDESPIYPILDNVNIVAKFIDGIKIFGKIKVTFLFSKNRANFQINHTECISTILFENLRKLSFLNKSDLDYIHCESDKSIILNRHGTVKLFYDGIFDSNVVL